MVEHFTAERLVNKKLGKSDPYYRDLEQAQKIVINSAYGMLATPGLAFNSPPLAGFVTGKGREILKQAINWAEMNSYKLVGADTDSIAFCYPRGTEMTERWREILLEQLNLISPNSIRWEDDGYYPRMLVLKAKNYVLDDGRKLKIKGSALKATTKEKALQEFIQRAVETLLDGKPLHDLYNTYAREILTISDIARWASKKSYTDAILHSTRTNEAKVRTALEGSDYRPGDKFYVYFTGDESLKLVEHWSGDHDISRLLGKLHDTSQVFSTVADLTLCPNYTLKRNQSLRLALI